MTALEAWLIYMVPRILVLCSETSVVQSLAADKALPWIIWPIVTEVTKTKDNKNDKVDYNIIIIIILYRDRRFMTFRQKSETYTEISGTCIYILQVADDYY